MALGICWKSGVAAEVIGLPNGSIGDALYRAKITPVSYTHLDVYKRQSQTRRSGWAAILQNIISSKYAQSNAKGI